MKPLKASVYYPQGNSTVERLHSAIKNRLARIKSEFPRKGLQSCLYKILFDIRSIPNEVTGQTPFFLLTGRVMRTKISNLQVSGLPNQVAVTPKDINKYYSSKKTLLRKYKVGTNVLVRRGAGNKFTQKGVITKVINPTTYRIKFPSRREAMHNQFHLKPVRWFLLLNVDFARKAFPMKEKQNICFDIYLNPRGLSPDSLQWRNVGFEKS